MAFEADCGVSTMLKALRVTSTTRFLVPGEYRVSAALIVSCRVFHDASVTLWCARLACTMDFSARATNPKIWIASPRAVKSEIRNPKSEIS